MVGAVRAVVVTKLGRLSLRAGFFSVSASSFSESASMVAGASGVMLVGSSRIGGVEFFSTVGLRLFSAAWVVAVHNKKVSIIEVIP